MNKYSSILLCLFSLSGIVHGTTYSTNFNLYDPGDLSGQDGWTVDSSNNSVGYLSFIASWNGSKAAAFGGNYAAPNTATVGLSRSYSAALSRSSFSFDFTLIDSDNVFPNRDAFGFSLTSSGSNLFTVFFTPDSQNSNPGDNIAQWNLSYQVGTASTISLTQAVLEGGAYGFDLSFSPNGSEIDFNLTTTSGLNTQNRSGTIAIDPITRITDMGLVWNLYDNDPTSAGANYILIDNLVAVPEPSSALLACLAGLAMVARRRR